MIRSKTIFNLIFQLLVSYFLSKNCYAQTKIYKVSDPNNSNQTRPIESNKTNEQNNDIISTENNNSLSIATIQILNKVTAKSEEVKIKIGEAIEFDTLIIRARKCWKSSPDQKPENKILLQITQEPAEDKKTHLTSFAVMTLFDGWMFSSSPSISGLEHPIYDITAINCE